MKLKHLAAAIGLGLASHSYGAEQPNIVVIFGDDVGWQNISAYGMGTMGYQTPNLDSIGNSGSVLPITMPSPVPRRGEPPSLPGSTRSAAV